MGPDAGIGAWCRHERHAALRLVVDVQEIRGEIVGRLTALRDDCTSAEVHRRMAEIYGEREGTRRMMNMVLRSPADWGANGLSARNRSIQADRRSLRGSPKRA